MEGGRGQEGGPLSFMGVKWELLLDVMKYHGAESWPPELSASSPPEPVIVTAYGKRELAGVIKLKALRWGDGAG